MRFGIASTVVLCLGENVAAYSDMGHRTVALLAHEYLSSEAVEFYDGILANDLGFGFDDAATWADVVKRKRPYTKTWHYIDARDVGEGKDSAPKNCRLNFPSDCDYQKTGCIISAVANQTGLFLDTRAPPLVRKEALTYIMHFWGDLHQPLHIKDTFRGGNSVVAQWRNRHSGVNLHSIWDSYIPNKITGMKDGAPNEEEKVYATEWADKLFSLNRNSGINSAAECSTVQSPDKCSLKWARESNLWICKYVMQPNVDWLESHDLSGEYFEGAAPIVEELVGKAGARLGAWLNSMHSVITTAGAVEVNDEQEPLVWAKEEM